MVIDINKLKVHPYHKKIYQSNDIDDLVKSIREVGLLEKIVVNNKRDLIIISGFRRWIALKELGNKTVDVEIKNINADDELLTLISFNKQREKTLLEKLNEADFLKSIWKQKRGRKPTPTKVIQLDPIQKNDTRAKVAKEVGLSTGQLSKAQYIRDKNPKYLELIDTGELTVNLAHKAIKKEEEKQERKKQVQAVQAQISTTIDKDYYKIINKSSDDLSDLPSQSIQTIFTSPPYWNKREYLGAVDELGMEKANEVFVQRLVNHLHCSYNVLKEEGSFFLNLGDTFFENCLQSIPHRVVIELVKKGWILRNTIVWKKTNTNPSTVKNNLTPSYEYIFHLVKSKGYYYNPLELPLKDKSKIQAKLVIKKGKDGETVDLKNISISGIGTTKKLEDFWTEDIVTTATANQRAVKKYGGVSHAAPFPVEISIMPILQTSKPGDTVLDLFSGSGTTGEVALKLGRRYIGYDNDPSHNLTQQNRLNKAVETYNNYSQINQAA